jgi:hypothetical protein
MGRRGVAGGEANRAPRARPGNVLNGFPTLDELHGKEKAQQRMGDATDATDAPTAWARLAGVQSRLNTPVTAARSNAASSHPKPVSSHSTRFGPLSFGV